MQHTWLFTTTRPHCRNEPNASTWLSCLLILTAALWRNCINILHTKIWINIFLSFECKVALRSLIYCGYLTVIQVELLILKPFEESQQVVWFIALGLASWWEVGEEGGYKYLFMFSWALYWFFKLMRFDSTMTAHAFLCRFLQIEASNIYI